MAASRSPKAKAAAPTGPLVDVPLPGGRVWRQRMAPDPARFEQWFAIVRRLGQKPTDALLRTRERIALLAAYDGGWDVRGADGSHLPAPRRLTLRGWNNVPREVIEALIDHLHREEEKGLANMGRYAQARAAAAVSVAGAAGQNPHQESQPGG